MNITYFIQLFDDQLEQCQWLRFNERTPVGAAQAGGFEFILDEARGQHLVLILPAASVVLHKVNLLAKSRSQIQAALPFALEEQLASDVDTMHFAYRTLDRHSGEQLVAVIDRAFMEALFGLLMQRKFASVKILPQMLVVPFEEGAWSLFSQRDYTILRKGLSEGYAMDAIAMDELIATEAELYRQQNDSDPEITRYDYSAGTEQEHPGGGDSAALAVMARYCLDHPDAGINLLQGDFQLVKPMADVIRQWSRVAGLAGVALFFYLATVGLENYRLASERDRLQASMQELYQQIFNEEPTERPVDAMRKKLVSLGKDSSKNCNSASPKSPSMSNSRPSPPITARCAGDSFSRHSREGSREVLVRQPQRARAMVGHRSCRRPGDFSLLSHRGPAAAQCQQGTA
ncbi:MAG: type II secretion system protein GspL [Gammaproteobacteria bacterium]